MVVQVEIARFGLGQEFARDGRLPCQVQTASSLMDDFGKRGEGMDSQIPFEQPAVIMVVDDEKSVRHILRLALEGEGYTVVEAGDGRQALQLATAQLPDLVLLDVMMPYLDGIETCVRLRALPGGDEVPVLMVTGGQDDTAVPKAFAAGATDFIYKPVMLTVLRHRVGRLLDIRRNQIALRRAHTDNQQLLAAITTILISLTPEGSVQHWNRVAAATFDIPAASIIGQRLADAHLPWDGERVAVAIRACTANHQEVRLDDVRYRRSGGHEGVMTVSVSPLTDDRWTADGALLLGDDITERKWLEAQLSQAQRLESIGRLAAGVAHEINTPVQYVSDNMRFLQDAFRDLSRLVRAYRQPDSWEPDELQTETDYLLAEIPQAIVQSLEGLERIAQIVRSMKDFSHPSSTEKTVIDLNRALMSTATVARHEWKYVAEVAFDLDQSLSPVLGLPGELNQVFLNILVNAAHAIGKVPRKDHDPKGRIVISSRQVGTWAEVRISDNGPGIPQSTRPLIFEPFFTTKEVGKGTGQGLAIARSVIVDKHQGEIFFESEVGQGTTFVVRLPLEVAETNSHAIPTESAVR